MHSTITFYNDKNDQKTHTRSFPSQLPFLRPLLFHPLSYLGLQQANSRPEFHSASDRAAIFYLKTVRRINIDSKGRGKFTEHYLLRLIKPTQNVKQTPMVFEADYNLLGQITVMSNPTMDKLC